MDGGWATTPLVYFASNRGATASQTGPGATSRGANSDKQTTGQRLGEGPATSGCFDFKKTRKCGNRVYAIPEKKEFLGEAS